MTPPIETGRGSGWFVRREQVAPIEIGDRRLVQVGELEPGHASVDVDGERHLLADHRVLLIDDRAQEDLRIERSVERELGIGGRLGLLLGLGRVEDAGQPGKHAERIEWTR